MPIKTWDISKIDESVQEQLVSQLWQVQTYGFDAVLPLLETYDAVERACNLDFKDKPSPTGQASNDSTTSQNPAIEQFLGSNFDRGDSEHKYFLPIVAEQKEGWTGHIKRNTFPVNGKFFKVGFKWHKQLSKKFPFLVEVVEDCWNAFGEVAFSAIDAKPKLIQDAMQMVMFGQTFHGMEYDEDLELVGVRPLNARNCAIHPPTGNVDNCTKIVRSQIPISELEGYPGISEEQLDKLVPCDMVRNTSLSESDREDMNELAYGNVRIFTFFIPSVRIKYGRKNQKVFKLKNAYIHMAVNEEGTIDESGKSKPYMVLLEITELPSKLYCPIQYGTFGPLLAQRVYQKGKLSNYLGFNYLANMVTSTAAQAVPLKVFPPLKVPRNRKGANHLFNWAPRAQWPLDKKDDIEAVELNINIDAFLMFLKWIYSVVGRGGGITDTLVGVDANPSSRKSATQARQETQSGEVRIDYDADWHSDTFIKYFVLSYFLLTQAYMEQQVTDLLEEWNEKTVKRKKKPDEKKKWEFIKDNSPLFRNWLVFTNIEEKIKIKVQQLNAGGMEMTAALTEQMMSTQLLYEIAIEPLRTTNIIVEPASSDITKREKRQDFLDYVLAFLLKLPLQEQGMVLKLRKVIEQGAKLFDMPESDFVEMLQQAQAAGVAPSATTIQPGTKGPEIQQTPQEEVPVEEVPVEQNA